MIFYTGIHVVSLAHFVDRAFISVNVLRSQNRQSFFNVGDWIMDSGAFSELLLYGKFRFPVSEYAGWINRFSSCGNLELAVSQDYMCEPTMLEKTGLTITEHQRLTILRYDELLPLSHIPIMPVLQGYSPSDYVSHIQQYSSRLAYGMRVGVGSVCKRNGNPQAIVDVLEIIKSSRSDLKLHGFGLKKTALKNAYIASLLYSADSMAWSWAGRKQKNGANSGLRASDFSEEINLTMGTKPHQFVFSNEIGGLNEPKNYGRKNKSRKPAENGEQISEDF